MTCEECSAHSFTQQTLLTTLGPRKGLRKGPPASGCHDNPSLSLSHPSFSRSPKYRDPLPHTPRGCLFPPAVSLPPCLASKAFFGFLGASLVAKRQRSVPLLLARILCSWGGGHGHRVSEESLPQKKVPLPVLCLPATPFSLQGAPAGDRNLEAVGEAQRGQERALRSQSKLEMEEIET